MAFQLIKGSVLDADADALVLTMDGARPGMEGNIARAFERRWPDAYGEVSEQIRHPVPLGRTIPTVAESPIPFKLVLWASTLHHEHVLSDAEKTSIVANALNEAVRLAIQHRCRSIATAVMTGGWRVSFDEALQVMLRTLGPSASNQFMPTVSIYVLSGREWERAQSTLAELQQ